MPHAFIPEGSVVLSRDDYDKLSAKAKELERIERQQAAESHRAFAIAHYCGHKVIFRTKDGLDCEDRIPATQNLRHIRRPIRPKISPEYQPEQDGVPHSAVIPYRAYVLKGYNHERQAFVYEEE